MSRAPAEAHNFPNDESSSLELCYAWLTAQSPFLPLPPSLSLDLGSGSWNGKSPTSYEQPEIAVAHDEQDHDLLFNVLCARPGWLFSTSLLVG